MPGHGIQECCFHFGNFSRKFNRGVKVVCLFNELFYFVSVDSPEREYIIYITFPNERFKWFALWRFGFRFCLFLPC